MRSHFLVKLEASGFKILLDMFIELFYKNNIFLTVKYVYGGVVNQSLHLTSSVKFRIYKNH